jgi:membrane associated rhomboid family serine protease
VDGEIDFTKYDESELVDAFSRIDPRRAPINHARLKERLIERGYVIYEGDLGGPGSAVPSADKLQALIGSTNPFECKVIFSQSSGPFRWLEPAHNEIGFVDSGALRADGIHLELSGRRSGVPGFFGSLFQLHVQLNWGSIVDVELDDSVVHLVYSPPNVEVRSITLWLPDRSAAERLVTILPKERTATFRPQLKAHVEFERQLLAQSPQTPVTVGLVAINVLVFLAMALSGQTLTEWGSNFGPYTTSGEWWRLLTALFLHGGVLHLVFNMWALASFGPLAERLYGSVNYLILYLVAGVAGSLASLSWRPDVNGVGASGAILGILGALLAAQLRGGESFPGNIVRPLRNTTLVFLGWTLYAGFSSKGIDNAAHLGGVAAGFLLGLFAARPITGERLSSRNELRRVIQMMSLGATLLVGGFYFAQRASASMVGEGLYWRTSRWFFAGEHAANVRFNTALHLAKSDTQNQTALADTLEKDVLPFWRMAADRLSAVELRSDSPHLARLERLQDISDGRAHAYERFLEGLRKNDAEEIEEAVKELDQVDQLASKPPESQQ